jgi:O-antigen ligase
MFEKIKILVYSNILLSQILFFSLFAILGLTYQGSSESSIYTLYLVISSFLAYFFFFLELIGRGTFKPILVTIFTIPIIFLFFVLLAPRHSFVQSQSNLFFVLVMPSLFVGYIAARTNKIYLINKGFIFTAFIVFVGVLRIFPKLIGSSVIELMDVFGGGQYQAFSYFCAFSFLTFLRHYLNQSRLKSWQNYMYGFIFIVLLTGVVFSGGRGGLIVVSVGLVVFIILKKGFLSFMKYFIFISIFLFALSLFLIKSDFFFSERLIDSFDRLFSFFSINGIEMEGTSGRNDFYNIAVVNINNSLFFGYGLFGLVESHGEYYPHNLFLEILLQGGLIYFVIFNTILISFFLKLYRLVKLKKNQEIILIPTIYSFVMLMFSSSYLQEPFFWFSLTYVFSYEHNKVDFDK